MSGKKTNRNAFELGPYLNAVLHRVVFENGSIGRETFKTLYPFCKELVEQSKWRPYLSVFDAYMYIRIQIVSFVDSKDFTGVTNLADVLTGGQLAILQKRIQEYLESIPRTYQLWIRLPNMPKWGEGHLKLSRDLHLIETTPSGIPKNLGELFLGNGMLRQRFLEETSIYLRVDCHGFGSFRTETTAVTSAISLLKQFFQMSSLAEIIHTKNTMTLAEAVTSRRRNYALYDPAIQEAELIDLPTPLTDYLQSVSISESKLTTFEPGQTLLGSKERAAANRAEKSEALCRLLKYDMLLLDQPEGVDISRIKTALEWLFDAQHTPNQTIAFIQGCIGLEALLGDDKQDEPLTRRLADRCAYLLGKVQSEREKIKETFINIYSARSKLVHGRKPRLDVGEEHLLDMTQSLLIDVLRREISNVKRAAAQQQ